MKTVETVERLVREPIEKAGFSLCDVEFARESGNWVLTLYIDREGGVDLDACEKVSRLVDPILDEADPIDRSYYLSVSSLGIDRPLKKDADYARNIGKELEVRLYRPLNGSKVLTGILRSFDGTAFRIEDGNGSETEILRKDAALVRPYIRF